VVWCAAVAGCALAQLELLKMDPTFLNRNVNQGFSGGEKKRNEILQLAVLEVCILSSLSCEIGNKVAAAWHISDD